MNYFKARQIADGSGWRYTVRNCRSHGVTGTTATTGGLCGHCSRFQSDWKCLPDRRICRAWDRGSKSIPNGWVMEAKAASRVKPGRSRAS